MKIRNGYVSNSSSSSYVIIGKKMGDIFDIKKEDMDFKNEEYVCFGKWLYDGEDIIDLNKTKFDFIRKHKKELKEDGEFSGLVVRVIDYHTEDDCFEFDLETSYNLGNRKVNVFTGSVDYHCTNDIKDFSVHYGIKMKGE